MEDNQVQAQDQNVSEIDAAINAMKARKAGKAAAAAGSDAPAASAPAAEPSRPRLTEEEKAARTAARDAERAQRKAAREAARAEKLAAQAAARKPAHMKKVEKAGERLSELSEPAQLLFNEATANLSSADLAQLAAHILYFNRVNATARALTQKLEEGQTVRIVSGDPRFIGKTGTLAKVQRIRCYVTVEGLNKPVYLFTSDVQLATAHSESEELDVEESEDEEEMPEAAAS